MTKLIYCENRTAQNARCVGREGASQTLLEDHNSMTLRNTNEHTVLLMYVAGMCAQREKSV